jgi:uncharacterized protein YecE (DUF72 family)
MEIRVGTSGFSYSPWKGRFYPKDLPASRMLSYYSSVFPTVEINNTFYRMPTPALLSGWLSQVPETFRFSLKAPQRLTHTKAIAQSSERIPAFLEVAATLGDRLGPILFQFPPFLKKDLGQLAEFLGRVPGETLAALEFRHESWFEEDLYQMLSDHGVALCLAETDKASPPEIGIGPFGYFRLRKTEYDEDALKRWTAFLRRQSWKEAYVFFKHEDEAKGPEFATSLITMLNG